MTEKDGVLTFFCHHGCGLSGGVRLNHGERRMEYGRKMTSLSVVPPSPPTPGRGARTVEQDELSAGIVDYLLSRGISQETACNCGVGSRTLPLRTPEGRALRETIVFPYKQDGRAYAQKARTYPDKLFVQVGSCQTLWLQDQVIGGQDLFIVEGEFDALSVREVGHNDVVSVPNGAPMKVSENPDAVERKYQYLAHAQEIFSKATRVVIAVDDDPQGQALGEEIARRWGKAKSWRVVWPVGCKDANDVLVKYGPEQLRTTLSNPEPWPVAGVYNAKHFSGEVRSLYEQGLGKGADPGLGLDHLYTLGPGQLTVVTGLPGSGKSSVFNQIMVNMAADHGWSSAIYSSETPPVLHIPILASIYNGKPFFDGPRMRMSWAELDMAEQWIEDHFTFLHFESTPTYREVIEKLEVAVLRAGIRLAIIDPASYLSRSGDNDVEWVGQMLEAFRCFAQSHEVHVIVVAHPHKMQPGQIPQGYSISGSAHWTNRADFGITVHRPEDNRDLTKFVVWKVRWSWMGSEGESDLFFDKPTGRFSDFPFNERRYEPIGDDPWA